MHGWRAVVFLLCGFVALDMLALMIDAMTKEPVTLIVSLGIAYWLSQTADGPRRRRRQRRP
jgi:hypothetical protein